jgi:predicted GTPase
LNPQQGSSSSYYTAVFLGKRGVGKSTTLNRLFGLSLPTDPAVECTRKPQPHWKSLSDGTAWQLVDMPGLAANIKTTDQYSHHYRRWLNKADVVVWITQADVRAYKQDERFFLTYSSAIRPATRLVLGISKIDTQVAHDGPMSSELLIANDIVRRKIADVRDRIVPHSWARAEQVSIVPYSITREWNIDVLYNTILTPQRRD